MVQTLETQAEPTPSFAGAKLLRGIAALERIMTSIVRTRSLAYARLYVKAMASKSHTVGQFSFPFGVVRYVDIQSLPFIYHEIFVDRVYSTLGLGDRPNILDCGGNIGLSTVAFKQQYPGATITVFEADPRIAGFLDDNVRGLGYADVTVVHAAVTSSPGTAAFLEDGAIGGRITGEVSKGTVPITTVRLSDYIRAPVDLLKLDIEGAEFEVVDDLCATGKISLVRNLVCEVHGTGAVPDPVPRLWASLSQAGFLVSANEAFGIDEKTDHRSKPPFLLLPSAHFRMLLYAWRPQ